MDKNIAGSGFSAIAPVAVVIGASSGIGRALVEQLLKMPHWATVYAGSRTAVSALSDIKDERLSAFTIDVSDTKSIVEAFDNIAAKHRNIGLLCYCSGLLHSETLQPEKRLADLNFEALQRSFAVNTFGAAIVMQQAQKLLTNKPAIVVNLSARVGSIDDNRLGGWYSYRAAKAAQNMLTRTACIEIGRHNKQFAGIAFHPGTTQTALSAPFRSNVAAEKLFSANQAATQMLTVASQLTAADNGSFKAWDGSAIAW